VSKHILVECVDLSDVRNKHFVASSIKDVFDHHHHVRLVKSCHNATCTWKEIKIKHIKWKYKIMEQ